MDCKPSLFFACSSVRRFINFVNREKIRIAC